MLATEYRWAEPALERTHTRALDATNRLHTTRIAASASRCPPPLITGGAAVAVIVDAHRYLISGLVAGLAALATLIPATQRLIDRPLSPSTSREPDTANATNTRLPLRLERRPT